MLDPVKYAPGLLDDYRLPGDLMGRSLEKHPNMYFAELVLSPLHYDIDLAHIFHTHFSGRNQVIVFDYK